MYLYLYANRNRALFYAILQTPGFRPIYVFEVDGYGNRTGLLNSITVE